MLRSASVSDRNVVDSPLHGPGHLVSVLIELELDAHVRRRVSLQPRVGQAERGEVADVEAAEFVDPTTVLARLGVRRALVAQDGARVGVEIGIVAHVARHADLAGLRPDPVVAHGLVGHDDDGVALRRVDVDAGHNERALRHTVHWQQRMNKAHGKARHRD